MKKLRFEKADVFQLKIYTKNRRKPFVFESASSMIDEFDSCVQISDVVRFKSIVFMRNDLLHAYEK